MANTRKHSEEMQCTAVIKKETLILIMDLKICIHNPTSK